MTHTGNARPGTVTAAQVIIWVLGALGAVGGGLVLVLGVVGLVSGASVAASAAGTEASGLGAAFGGLIGVFSGGLVVAGVLSLAVVGLWFWIASALGRASRAARIVATVLCGLDVVWGLFALVGSLADRAGASALGALLLLAIPATLMGLLWGAESSRRFFDGVPAGLPAQRGPAPMSPPAGFGQPQWDRQQWDQQQWGQRQWGQQQWGQPAAGQPQYGQQQYGQARFAQEQVPEGVTAPVRLPAARCRTCRTELRTGWAHCGGCGAPITPPRPVGA